MTPHSQRCETCNFAEKHEGLYKVKCMVSKPVPMVVHPYTVQWIGYVGCASHSSQQSEREKVPIICLCGSTRFTREMLIKQWELTKQGYIVVSWCALPDDYTSYRGNEKSHIGDIENVKAFVDEIHKRKIDISDEVLVIDIGGYIGESTRSEINYAINMGKPVRYLSEELRTIKQEELG